MAAVDFYTRWQALPVGTGRTHDIISFMPHRDCYDLGCMIIRSSIDLDDLHPPWHPAHEYTIHPRRQRNRRTTAA